MSDDDLIAEAISYWCEEETDDQRRKVRVQYDTLRAERDRLRQSEEDLQIMIHGMDDKLEKVEIERDRLREALERIAEANWLDDPHEARRIARAALAKEAGQ
jgi:chromosome segregation ATPase